MGPVFAGRLAFSMMEVAMGSIYKKGQHWYSRQLLRTDVLLLTTDGHDGRIMSVK
jgi:hypothetical protein